MPDADTPEAVVVSQALEEPTELDQARVDQGMAGERVVYVEAVEL